MRIRYNHPYYKQPERIMTLGEAIKFDLAGQETEDKINSLADKIAAIADFLVNHEGLLNDKTILDLAGSHCEIVESERNKLDD